MTMPDQNDVTALTRGDAALLLTQIHGLHGKIDSMVDTVRVVAERVGSLDERQLSMNSKVSLTIVDLAKTQASVTLLDAKVGGVEKKLDLAQKGVVWVAKLGGPPLLALIGARLGGWV